MDFIKKGDLGVVYKLSQLVESAHPASEIQITLDEHATLLVSHFLSGGGWGEYYFSPETRDGKPRITATAVALLALRGYDRFPRDCRKAAVRWLCGEERRKTYTRLHELALSAWVMTEYQSFSKDVGDYEEALSSAKARLVQAVIEREEWRVGVPDVHHYTVNNGQRRENRYIWFLSDCIAAFVLLKLGNPPASRLFVLRVTNYFVNNISAKHGFTPVNSQRVSTLDHLWVARLLRQFAETNIDALMPPIWSWRAMPRITRLFIVLLCLSIAAVTIYLSTKSWTATVLAVAGGIALSVVANLATPSTDGK